MKIKNIPISTPQEEKVQYCIKENDKQIYPFPTRNLGAVVAVNTCSPSADHWKLVVSGDNVWAINFFLVRSQNSMLPLRLPKPHKHKSETLLRNMHNNASS